eukprot:PhF_6_TR3343/c0_g1_i1/m.4722
MEIFHPKLLFCYVCMSYAMVFCISSVTYFHRPWSFSFPWIHHVIVPRAMMSDEAYSNTPPMDVTWNKVPADSDRISSYLGNSHEICFCDPDLQCFRPSPSLETVAAKDPHAVFTSSLDGKEGWSLLVNVSWLRGAVPSRFFVDIVIDYKYGKRQQKDGMVRPLLLLVPPEQSSQRSLDSLFAARNPPPSISPRYTISFSGRAAEAIGIPNEYVCPEWKNGGSGYLWYMLFFGRWKHYWICFDVAVILLWLTWYLCFRREQLQAGEGYHFFSYPISPTHLYPIWWQLPVFLYSSTHTYDFYRLFVLVLTICYAFVVDTWLLRLKVALTHLTKGGGGVHEMNRGFTVGVIPIVLSISLLGRWGTLGDSDPHLYLLAIMLALISKHFLLHPWSGWRHVWNPSGFAFGVLGVYQLLYDNYHSLDASGHLGEARFLYIFINYLSLIPASLMPQVSVILFSATVFGDMFEHFSLNNLVYTSNSFYITDPATSPKALLGCVIYGICAGWITNKGTALLMTYGIFEYYAKIMPPLFLNPLVPVFNNSKLLSFDSIVSIPSLHFACMLTTTTYAFTNGSHSLLVISGVVYFFLSHFLIEPRWVQNKAIRRLGICWVVQTFLIVGYTVTCAGDWQGKGPSGRTEMDDTGVHFAHYTSCK